MLCATFGVAVLMGATAAWAQATAPSAGAGSPADTPQPVLPLTSDQVAAHLGETVDWYHHLSAVEQLPLAATDTATRDKLHQQALTAVELAFDFARACAVLLDAQSRSEAQPRPEAQSRQTAPTPPPAATAKGFAGRLDQAADDIAQRMATLQSQLDGINQQLAHARGKERETLLAQQAQATAALRLAKEVQASVQAMEDFEASSITGDNGNLSPLDGQIADMERSVPELATRHVRGASGASAAGTAKEGTSTAANTPAAVTAGSTPTGTGGMAAPQKNINAFHPESAGVVALVTQWYALREMRRQLDDAIKEAADLQDEIARLRATLTNVVRTVIGSGLALSTSTDPAQLLAQRQVLEATTTRFKQLSTVLVPIGEQALIVENEAGILEDWRGDLGTRMRTIARYMAARIGVIVAWIALVLLVSEIWKRATFRYLHDLRRRRQFMVLRRVAVAFALTVVIVLGMVSEIGSIATYIGFVTAGIAVALQNVILAVVAYFFLIGRYGVRVGDRITLASVTGRVVDIGLVRIYLMELSGADLHSTGRMVVLSNAVLFQPTALFKQIPGADYVWHTVTLTIDATADVVEAHKRLKAAANAVYDKYRAAIERQHAMVQRFIDFDASTPQPEVRLRLTENGLECSVRYPVELENAAVIDQQMLKALRDALEQDSPFKLVSSGGVVLKSSD
jgi:small-conductance mechanosensitive channel